MGYKFERPKPKPKKEALTDHQREYREREKREEERYKLAVDSGFWVCFCFHDEAERQRFAALADADAEGFCFGDHLREVFTERVGVKHVKSFKPRAPKGERVPDPFEGLEPTDDLEADCFAEAEAILSAFEAREVPDRCENVWDSPYHVVAIFRDSDDVERFIEDFALAKFGDLYMDGPAVLGYLKE